MWKGVSECHLMHFRGPDGTGNRTAAQLVFFWSLQVLLKNALNMPPWIFVETSFSQLLEAIGTSYQTSFGMIQPTISTLNNQHVRNTCQIWKMFQKDFVNF